MDFYDLKFKSLGNILSISFYYNPFDKLI